MKDLIKFIWSVITFFAPPGAKEDPSCSPTGALWRWKTFAGVLLLYAIVGFHIAWVCGQLTPYGFVGVAWASDLRKSELILTELQKSGITTKLAADQLRICRLGQAARQPGAQMDILQSALDSAQEAFRAHLTEYSRINEGRGYDIQPCSVILITGG